jgi:uncharacterized membrane protein YeaQ/YmgE (transglycosylase-associated protein family)
VGVVGWIVLGAVLGGLAALVLGTRGRDVVALVTVGTLGGLLGGFLASAVVGLDVVEPNPTSLLVAAVGALVLIGVLQTVPESYD